MVFTAIIVMTVRKKFLNRQLEINRQYELELNDYGELLKYVGEQDDQLKKKLGELPPEPIYDYIDELSIEEEMSISKATLQNESTLKK